MAEPIAAPMALAVINAEADAIKTKNGLLELADAATVTSCVLSPNSPKKTAINTDTKKWMSIC